MRVKVAERILKENRLSYDKMAGEFSSTRARFWDELTFLAEHALPEMKVLDIGCGNGRFYPLLKERNIDYTGVDSSDGLLKEARDKNPDAHFENADATALPFPDATFTIAYSFAVIHHIPSKKLREKFVQEAARVLHKGNTLIISSWYLWQPRYLPALFLTALKSIFFLSPLDVGDMMHTFGKGKAPRYLHAFTKRELERLLSKNGFEIIGSDLISRESGSGSTNIVIVAKKR